MIDNNRLEKNTQFICMGVQTGVELKFNSIEIRNANKTKTKSVDFFTITRSVSCQEKNNSMVLINTI